MWSDSEMPIRYAPEQLEREIRARWARFMVSYLARALFGWRAPGIGAADDLALGTASVGIVAAAPGPGRSLRWLLRSRGFWLFALVSILALWRASEAHSMASFVISFILWLVGLGFVGWAVLIWRLVFSTRLEID